MSYYYNYYIGYKSQGKIYPLGPYNSIGRLKDVISRSSSFASDLHEDFSCIKETEISDELRKEFTTKDWNGNEVVAVKYLPISDLPTGSFVKKGYFLIEDVKRYEDNSDDNWDFEGFYDCVTPTVYAAMLEHELKFGKPKRQKDDFGEWYTPKAASDYMYYAYPDYESKEYEAFMIRNVAEMLRPWSNFPEDAVLVALETEG